MLDFIVGCLYFMLPAYFANMAPVLVRKFFKELATPIDGGMQFNGQPVLGKNKTWRGLIAGTIIATIVAFIQFKLNFTWSIIDYEYWFFIGPLMGFGALAGDAVKSFFKRRAGIAPGKPFIPWDQLDFVIGSLLFTFMFFPKSARLENVIAILIISPILHIIVNHIAFYLKIRKVKW